jgi:hypothetical protein
MIKLFVDLEGGETEEIPMNKEWTISEIEVQLNAKFGRAGWITFHIDNPDYS